MPIRVHWAEPGEKAEVALRQYWSLAYDLAADHIAHPRERQRPLERRDPVERKKKERTREREAG